MANDNIFSNSVQAFSRILEGAEITDLEGTHLSNDLFTNTMSDALLNLKCANGNLYIVGNGGSSSVASHAVTDFLNIHSIKANTIHDHALLTCMSNDYGYENAYANILDKLLESRDILICISSSGQSLNILNAGHKAIEKGASVITLSGFKKNNPLRAIGDYNYWLNSSDYGAVEIGHQFILHHISDYMRTYSSRGKDA